MDIYKFRGKAIEPFVNGNQWISGFGVFMPEMVDETEEAWLYTTNGVYEVDPSTVGQYTGLSDKNGVEIYEGDVVKTVALLNDHNQRGAISKVIVRYYNGGYCLCFEGYESGTAIQSSFLVSHEIEIIGNIHDKELLEG